MPDFAHELRAAIEADARDHHGATALPGTRHTIGRRRRRAAAAYGAGSALALGALAVAVASVAVTGRDNPEPPLAASLSPSPSSTSPIAYATVDLSRDADIAWDGSHAMPACGSPAPVPTSENGDFSAAFEIDATQPLEQDDRYGDQRSLATVTVTSHVDEKVPAFSHAPRGLLVRDGVIAGYVDSHAGSTWRTFAPGGQVTGTLEWWGYSYGCDDGEYGEPVDAGEYEMFVMARVSASEAEVGAYAVSLSSTYLLPAEQLEFLVPGSYECERYTDYASGPLSCDPGQMPGAAFDLEAGTVTVPYETYLYDRDVDALMVSDPVTVTVTEYRDFLVGRVALAGEPFTADTVPACGDQYSWIESGEVVLESSVTLGILDPGEVIEPEVWLSRELWDEAAVTLPARTRAWLYEGVAVPLGDGSSLQSQHIVGWVDLAAVTAGDVELTRYDGPEPWPLEVIDVAWCDPQATSSADGAVIVAEHTVTQDAVDHVTSDPIEIRPEW